MKIAIASGKGGTGKTTLSIALASIAEEKTMLLDCDVEEPNCHLFLNSEPTKTRAVNQLVPVVNSELCTSCGKCSELCQFNAIITIKDSGAMVFPEMCHSCGGCLAVCPTGAITEEPFQIGNVQHHTIDKGKELITGVLNVGLAMAPPVIKDVQKEMAGFDGLVIMDSPPGSSCPFVTTIKSSDFVIFVTEPTPFGLHDLKIAIDTIRETGVPFGVVVNRMETKINMVTEYCKNNNIDLLFQIENSRKVAETYSKGGTLIDAIPSLKPKLLNLIETVKGKVEDGVNL